MPDNPLSNLLRNKAMRVLTYLVTIALVAYTGYDIYQRYLVLHEVEEKIAGAMQPAAATSQSTRMVKDTRKVAAMYLFGKQKAKPKPLQKVIDAPITRLKLTLIGIVSASDPSNSKAVVQIDNKLVLIFKVGDTIPNTNAEVHQIQATQILLMRNGKLERLAINRPEIENTDRDSRHIMINRNSRAGVDNLLTPTEVLRSSSKRQREYNARNASSTAK